MSVSLFLAQNTYFSKMDRYLDPKRSPKKAVRWIKKIEKKGVFIFENKEDKKKIYAILNDIGEIKAGRALFRQILSCKGKAIHIAVKTNSNCYNSVEGVLNFSPSSSEELKFATYMDADTGEMVSKIEEPSNLLDKYSLIHELFHFVHYRKWEDFNDIAFNRYSENPNELNHQLLNPTFGDMEEQLTIMGIAPNLNPLKIPVLCENLFRKIDGMLLRTSHQVGHVSPKCIHLEPNIVDYITIGSWSEFYKTIQQDPSSITLPRDSLFMPEEKISPLNAAVLSGRWSIADFLLSKMSVNECSLDSIGSILHAAILSEKEMLPWALSRSNDANARDFRGMTPIMIAILRKNEKAFKSLLGKSDLNAISYGGLSVITIAAESDTDFYLKAILDSPRELDLNVRDSSGDSPLMRSILSNNKQSFDLLLDKSDLIAMNDQGCSPILYAFARKKTTDYFFNALFKKADQLGILEKMKIQLDSWK